MPADGGAVAAPAAADRTEARVTRRVLAWRRAARRPPALAGGAVVLFYVLLALGAPWLAPGGHPVRDGRPRTRRPLAGHLRHAHLHAGGGLLHSSGHGHRRPCGPCRRFL